jgi:hypothetical protein
MKVNGNGERAQKKAPQYQQRKEEHRQPQKEDAPVFGKIGKDRIEN